MVFFFYSVPNTSKKSGRIFENLQIAHVQTANQKRIIANLKIANQKAEN